MGAPGSLSPSCPVWECHWQAGFALPRTSHLPPLRGRWQAERPAQEHLGDDSFRLRARSLSEPQEGRWPLRSGLPDVPAPHCWLVASGHLFRCVLSSLRMTRIARVTAPGRLLTPLETRLVPKDVPPEIFFF